MADASRTARPTRRSTRGLVIEGTVVARDRPAPPRPTGADALAGLDLAARSEGRPYQSLLDDAIRLARRCRSSGIGAFRTAGRAG